MDLPVVQDMHSALNLCMYTPFRDYLLQASRNLQKHSHSE